MGTGGLCYADAYGRNCDARIGCSVPLSAIVDFFGLLFLFLATVPLGAMLLRAVEWGVRPAIQTFHPRTGAIGVLLQRCPTLRDRLPPHPGLREPAAVFGLLAFGGAAIVGTWWREGWTSPRTRTRMAAFLAGAHLGCWNPRLACNGAGCNGGSATAKLERRQLRVPFRSADSQRPYTSVDLPTVRGDWNHLSCRGGSMADPSRPPVRLAH